MASKIEICELHFPAENINRARAKNKLTKRDPPSIFSSKKGYVFVDIEVPQFRPYAYLCFINLIRETNSAPLSLTTEKEEEEEDVRGEIISDDDR